MNISKRFITRAVCAVLSVWGGALVAQAPLSPPALDTEFHEPTIDAPDLTAAGYVQALPLLTGRDTVTYGEHEIRNGALVVPGVPAVAAIDQRVRRWIDALDRSSLAPRGLLNVATLLVQLGDDAGAQRRIDQWLRTPKLTLNDTIATWGMAVTIFKDAQMTPRRLQIVRDYEARLEALPHKETMLTLCRARFDMAQAYGKAKQIDSLIAIGLRAYALDREMSYEQRWGLIMLSMDESRLLRIVVPLSGRPHGVEQIDSLLTVFRGYAELSPAELARDTALALIKPVVAEMAQRLYDQYHWLGHSAPPYIATHWLNMPPPTQTSNAAPGARVFPLNDGTIHLLGFGWFGCGACHGAMRRIQRELPSFPNGVRPMYHEYTEGYFGNDLVSPEEEVEDLKKFFLGRRHYTFPISIWAGPKDSTEAGGFLPRPSPTFKSLAVCAGPTFYVVDGKGIVRYMQEGYSGIGRETELRIVLDMLLQERDHGTPATPPPMPPTLPSSLNTPSDAP